MTLPLVTSQRGVGWTHVVNPPRVIRYLLRSELLDDVAVEVDVGFLVPELRSGRPVAPSDISPLAV